MSENTLLWLHFSIYLNCQACQIVTALSANSLLKRKRGTIRFRFTSLRFGLILIILDIYQVQYMTNFLKEKSLSTYAVSWYYITIILKVKIK